MNHTNIERFAGVLEYEGSIYHGWQKQEECLSLQEEIEKAIAKLALHPVQTFCAGRTDAGVHATTQVIHFETSKTRTLEQWFGGINSFLPRHIRLRQILKVDTHFHARFSAHYRRYVYIIHQSFIASAFFFKYVHWIRKSLNIESMQKAARFLIGEFDFNAFRSSHCQSHTSSRNILHLEVYSHQELIIIDISANAFLQHMVRIIVAHLIQIGLEKKDISWLLKIRDEKIRDSHIAMAPAHGLHLIDVGYRLPALENILKKPWFIA